MSRNFITKSKKNPLFSYENSGFLVRVAGFEPTASWTRTKRDTKLRHTRMTAGGPPMKGAGNQQRLLYRRGVHLSSAEGAVYFPERNILVLTTLGL